jgi:hypothetical protein
MMHFIAHWLGLDNASGPIYSFWSGFFGDVTILVGAVVVIYRLKKHVHTCHVDGCRKLAVHPVEGTPYVVCRKHHPSVPEKVTYQHVVKLHKESK